MLYGYGGFNISLLPGFSVGRIPFLEQGGVYAIANLREVVSMENHGIKQGLKCKNKMFLMTSLPQQNISLRKIHQLQKLAINGGSNGGLLVGACMTQRPGLFAVAIPEVGVLDMLRYQKFTIGWAWATDYGTAEDSQEMFEYLLGYSPLHNLKAGTTYPATLITTGDHDDRVVPAHSFKFAATLQELHSGHTPTLNRIDVKAGHGAGKPISKIIDAQTDVWAFVMKNVGMNYK